MIRIYSVRAQLRYKYILLFETVDKAEVMRKFLCHHKIPYCAQGTPVSLVFFSSRKEYTRPVFCNVVEAAA